MSVITSSNRTSSEWARYIERPVSIDRLMREAPHVGTPELIARNAIDVPKHGPFDQVIAVDECGAPIHVGTIGADITLARLEDS